MRKPLILAALVAFGLSSAGAHVPGLMEEMGAPHEHSGDAESHHHGDADDRHDGPNSPCEHQAQHCCCVHVTVAESPDVTSIVACVPSLRVNAPTCRPAQDPSARSILHVPIA